MPLLEVEVHLRLDGVPIAPFPVLRRLVVAQPASATVVKTNGDGASYVLLPTVDAFSTLNILFLKPDQTLGVRLNGSTPLNFSLNAGGFFFLVDGIINSGAANNLLVNNASASNANVLYFAASIT